MIRIAILEDSYTYRTLQKIELESSGIEVEVFDSPYAFLERCLKIKNYDLTLIDRFFTQPKRDLLKEKFPRKLREELPFFSSIIILWSNANVEEHEWRESGFDRVLKKELIEKETVEMILRETH